MNAYQTRVYDFGTLSANLNELHYRSGKPWTGSQDYGPSSGFGCDAQRFGWVLYSKKPMLHTLVLHKG